MSEYNFNNINDRYEYMAKLFYKRSGMLAPGKDDPIGFHDRRDRNEKWSEFMEEYHAEAMQAHFELSLKKDKE